MKLDFLPEFNGIAGAKSSKETLGITREPDARAVGAGARADETGRAGAMGKATGSAAAIGLGAIRSDVEDDGAETGAGAMKARGTAGPRVGVTWEVVLVTDDVMQAALSKCFD